MLIVKGKNNFMQELVKNFEKIRNKWKEEVPKSRKVKFWWIDEKENSIPIIHYDKPVLVFIERKNFGNIKSYPIDSIIELFSAFNKLGKDNLNRELDLESIQNEVVEELDL